MQPSRPITLVLTALLAMNLVSAEIDRPRGGPKLSLLTCLLYTSDAADE